jgi:hypothetical protein
MADYTGYCCNLYAVGDEFSPSISARIHYYRKIVGAEEVKGAQARGGRRINRSRWTGVPHLKRQISLERTQNRNALATAAALR